MIIDTAEGKVHLNIKIKKCAVKRVHQLAKVHLFLMLLFGFYFILFYFLGFGVVFLVIWGVVEYFFGF